MRQQLCDVTSGHSHQVWEVETVEAVIAIAGQGLHASTRLSHLDPYP